MPTVRFVCVFVGCVGLVGVWFGVCFGVVWVGVVMVVLVFWFGVC